MRDFLHYVTVGLATVTFTGAIYLAGGMNVLPVDARTSSNVAPQVIDHGPISADVKTDNFVPTACVSHVELRGPVGVRYTLMAPNGDVLHDGVHSQNQTVFFESGTLPSITHRITDESHTHLVLVNANETKTAGLASRDE